MLYFNAHAAVLDTRKQRHVFHSQAKLVKLQRMIMGIKLAAFLVNRGRTIKASKGRKGFDTKTQD